MFSAEAFGTDPQLTANWLDRGFGRDGQGKAKLCRHLEPTEVNSEVEEWAFMFWSLFIICHFYGVFPPGWYYLCKMSLHEGAEMCHRLLFVLRPKKPCMLGKVRQSDVCLQTAGTDSNNRVFVSYSVYTFSFLIEKLILKLVLLIKVTPRCHFCGRVSLDTRLKQKWVSLKR